MQFSTQTSATPSILTADTLDTICGIKALLGTLDHHASVEADDVPEDASGNPIWTAESDRLAAVMSPISIALYNAHSAVTVLENTFALALAEKERAERAPGLVMWGLGEGAGAAWMAEVDRVAIEETATKDFWNLMLGAKFGRL